MTTAVRRKIGLVIVDPAYGLVTPAFGDGSLADVLPSLAHAVGAPGCVDTLGLGVDDARAAVLLLVDGLGQRLLEQHAAAAPTLTALKERTLTTAFPATTAVSVTTIGTAVPPGVHGIVGYTMREQRVVLNVLRWTVDGKDVRDTVVPEEAQPHPTVFESADVIATTVGPGYQQGSGLTRAALRGADNLPVHAMGDLVTRVSEAIRRGSELVYAYHADLDLLGHVYGPGAPEWIEQLRFVDRLVERLIETLPTGTLLTVTGDHGMIATGADSRVDLDEEAALRVGVRLVGGEPRARYLYVEPGATGDVIAAWRSRLSGRALVLTRQEAIDLGWYGARVDDASRERIGDVIVLPTDASLVVVRSKGAAREAALRGHHGSLTEDEALVPLLVHRG